MSYIKNKILASVHEGRLRAFLAGYLALVLVYARTGAVWLLSDLVGGILRNKFNIETNMFGIYILFIILFSLFFCLLAEVKTECELKEDNEEEQINNNQK